MVASELVKLDANTRTGTGKQAAKRLRAGGLAPGIIYGLGKDPKPVTIPERVLAKALQETGGKSLIEVAVDDGEVEPVIVLEVQREPISREILHVDFKRLDITKADTFSVRLVLLGEALGVKDGGVLNVINDTIEIECLPTDLPDKITLEISELDVGAGLYVRDLTLAEEITLKTEPDTMLVNIVAPAEEIVEEVPEVEEAEVPEGEEVPEEGAEVPEGEAPAEEKKDTENWRRG